MADGLRIESLGDHLDLVPLVADWHWQEWGDDTVGSQVSWTATVARRLREDEVPFSLVALLDGEPVGAVSVCWDDADPEFGDDGPWLSGMVVRGPARNLGIGRRLLAAAGDRTVGMGHPALWAHTGEAEQFYARCGWEVVRPKEPLRRDAVVRRDLGEAPIIGAVGAILLLSDDAEGLATFYRDALGLPLEDEVHEDVPLHWACDLGGVHLAIHASDGWPGSAAPEARSPVLVLTTDDVQAAHERLVAHGVEATPPFDHGFAVLTTFRDPDGHHVQVMTLS